jgi:hypothetical protein
MRSFFFRRQDDGTIIRSGSEDDGAMMRPEERLYWLEKMQRLTRA